jgi:hypothetical protein
VTDNGSVAIRSYRLCFRVERRIHKIDRWQIPLPFGVPLRGAAYALALLVAVLVSSRAPLLGTVVVALPAPVRLLGLPVGGAYALLRWELDGRPAHAVVAAWLRLVFGPRRLVAFARAPRQQVAVLGDVTLVSDERRAWLRRAVVHGPGTVLLRYPFDARARGRALHVRRRPGAPRWRGKEVRLGRRQRLVVR